ncbi:sigma factor [[Mycoplasma] mobile]|uniref:sigma factor n=1 Tax=[Mycoplasma] mobile TaxID=2118 RepID=UPI0002DB8CDA|nr:sigma factor [[Mycoplasma] mobile]
MILAKKVGNKINMMINSNKIVKIETLEEVSKFTLKNWVMKHNDYLISSAKAILKKYNIPFLEYTDLLNEVYFKFEDLKKKFRPEQNVTFRTFFFKFSKFLMQNKCREYYGKKYSVLNKYYWIEDLEFALEDNYDLYQVPVDLKILSKDDLNMYDLVVEKNVHGRKLSKILKSKPSEIREKLSKIRKDLFY